MVGTSNQSLPEMTIDQVISVFEMDGTFQPWIQAALAMTSQA